MTFAAFATALWSDELVREREGRAFMLPGKITHQLLAGITEIGGRGSEEGREAATWRQTSFPCGAKGATVISALVFIWVLENVSKLESLTQPDAVMGRGNHSTN